MAWLQRNIRIGDAIDGALTRLAFLQPPVHCWYPPRMCLYNICRGALIGWRLAVKKNLQHVLIFCAGLVVGAACAGALAQGTSLAYAIKKVTEVTEPDAFSKVLSSTPVGLVHSVVATSSAG
jgi:F0F1-type ATP synthase membrane subunit c/vacuolar-type H+-ATPase subunit K